MENNIPDYFEEVKEYNSIDGMLSQMTPEEVNEYYMEQEQYMRRVESNNKYIYIKTSEDGQKFINIDMSSPLHPESPYYQKIFVMWDWVEIVGEMDMQDAYRLTSYLDGVCDVSIIKTYESFNVSIYNYVNDEDKRKSNRSFSRNRYSDFRVGVYKNGAKGFRNYKVTLSIASNRLREDKYKEKFISIRSFMIQDTIQIKRLDLSFLTLIDLSNVDMSLKYSKTKKTVKSNNKEAELLETLSFNNREIETTTLNTYKSRRQVTLYNKKVQLKERKFKDRKIMENISKLENIDHLYNLEFRFKPNSIKDTKEWRKVLDDFTLNKSILSYYDPKPIKNRTKEVYKSDFYYALMYLYVNDRALFRSKYPKQEKTMKRHYDDTRKKLANELEVFDFVRPLKETLAANEERLAQQIFDLTGCSI